MATVNSKIEWCDATWSPVRGCSRVSPGCDHCYAIGQAHRFSGPGMPYEGLTRYAGKRLGGVDWTGRAVFVPRQLEVPLRRRKPTTWFVNSMSDLFHESLSNEEIAAVFGVMAACPQHTFQCLTKRPKRMRQWFEWVGGAANAWLEKYGGTGKELPCDRRVLFVADTASDAHAPLQELDNVGPLPVTWPLPNVHLGVSVEDQQRADERIPLLLDTPASVRWVSAEPLLGPVDFARVPLDPTDRSIMQGIFNPLEGGGCETSTPWKIDWVVCGGESGPGARPCDVAWIRSIVEQCRAASVPVFCKQLGSLVIENRGLRGETVGGPGNPVVGARITDDGTVERQWRPKNKKGGDPAEWPADLRVRELPEVSR